MMYDSKVITLVWQIAAPVLMAVGTVGNVLTIAVLSRAGCRKSSTSVYLISLAVTDLAVVDVGLLRLWIIYIAGIDLRLLSDALCRLHWFFVYTTTEISSWLLVAVTLERLIGIIWPHRVRLICRRKPALYIVVAIVTIISLLSSHLLYGVGVHDRGQRNEIQNSKWNETSTLTIDMIEFGTNNHGNINTGNELNCNAFGHEDKIYQYFFTFIFPWVDMIVYGLIPAAVLLIADVLIIYRLYARKRLHRLMAVNFGGDKKLQNKTSSVTVMLVIVSVVFVVTTTPLCVFLISLPYWIDTNIGFTDTQQVIATTATLLMYLNHCVNFILYSLSGSNFRRKAVHLLRGNKIANSTTEFSSRPFTI